MQADYEKLFDPSSLILEAISGLCARGVPEDKAPYFHQHVSPLITEIVEMLMEKMPVRPDLAVLSWLVEMLDVPNVVRFPVKAWIDEELLGDQPERQMKGILKTRSARELETSAPDRTKRGSAAFITPGGLAVSEETLRRVAPLTPDQQTSLVQSQPMFQGLQPKEVKALVKAFDLCKYLDGEEVQKQGMKSGKLHIVVRGEGRVCVSQEVGTVKPGDLIGDQEILSGTPADVTVEAANGPLVTFNVSSLALKALGLKKRIGSMSRKKAMKIRDPTVRSVEASAHVQHGAVSRDDLQLISDALFANVNLKEVLHLTSEQVEQISREAYRQDFEPGDIVFNRGDYGDFFCIVSDGVYELSDTAMVEEAEVECVTKKVRTGDSFGELCLIYNAPRAATAKCVRKGSLWIISREVFKRSVQVKLHGRMQEYANLISTVDVFNMFRDQPGDETGESLSLVCNSLEEKFFIQGELIVEQGAEADCFYIIFEGSCVVVKDGVETAFLSRGNSFGERALLQADTRAASVRVVSDSCTVLAMDRVAFSLLLRPSGNGRTSLRAMNTKSNLEIAANLKSHVVDPLQATSKLKLSQLTRVGVLGRGAFGYVSLERGPQGQLVALKAMSKGHIAQEKLKNMVCNEKACMELLSSDFVVKLYGSTVDQKCVYFLLEPCFGGELFDVYADSGEDLWGSASHAMFYLACISEGLDHMHSRRVIYRDLKLENCLVTLSGYVKLTDMGISKVCVGKTYTVCGTTDYFAPETLRQTGHNRAVDWWAAGVLLYVMMTGRFPFEAPDTMKTYRKIIKGFTKVPFPEDFPEHCQSMVRALCQKNPEERLTMGALGFTNFKDHPWYRGFAWKNLEAFSMPAPWLPNLTEEAITEKAANKKVEELPEIPYEDDGSGWDQIFEDGDLLDDDGEEEN